MLTMTTLGGCDAVATVIDIASTGAYCSRFRVLQFRDAFRPVLLCFGCSGDDGSVGVGWKPDFN